MYQPWEQILFASPEISEKNENTNSVQSHRDEVGKESCSSKLRSWCNVNSVSPCNCERVLSVTNDPDSENNLGTCLPWVKDTHSKYIQFEVHDALTSIAMCLKDEMYW